jgi:hypothetical protein
MTITPPVTITPVGQGGAPVAALRLMIATPLYDGAQADYLRSVIGLTAAATQRGVGCSFAFLSNNAAIDRARNLLAAAFVQSDATHLVFIDGDIGFDPEALEQLLHVVAEVEMPGLPDGDKAPYQQMTFTLHDDQAELVKAAIDAAKGLGPFPDTGNENSNGNALARIAEHFVGVSHVG